jgi:endo-1,3-1,4-beta-glycanase ExoK
MRSSMHLLCSAVAAALVFRVAPAWAKPWKGAELITQQTFRYGAFEARILAARGSGFITPFFLWKHDSEVPGQEWQEQDFEIFGKDGSYQTQLMTPGEGGEQRTPHEAYHALPEPAWERYYTYRMEWTPDYLAFYVDGELVRIETDAEEYDKLLNPSRAEAAQLRVGVWAGDTDWCGPFDEAAVPAASFVSWVQTYSYTPGSGPDGSDFSPLWRDDFDTPGTSAPNSSRWWAANWTFDYAVNDYVSANARVRDGALVLAFTDESHVGALPEVPADEGGSP